MTTRRRLSLLHLFLILAAVSSLPGCSDMIAQLLTARRLAADLHAHFNKATDATNRAVMATTDEASAAFAR